MKRSVKYLVISIIVTFSIVVVSIPFWNFANNKRIGFFNEGYTSLPVVVRVGKFPSLVIADDEKALSIIEETDILLKNRNGHKMNSRLYLLVEKRSTIPTMYLRVSIDDEIYEIANLERDEDTENYYFYLNNIDTDSYEEVLLKTRIWLSNDVSGVDSNSSLVANFIVR